MKNQLVKYLNSLSWEKCGTGGIYIYFVTKIQLVLVTVDNKKVIENLQID